MVSLRQSQRWSHSVVSGTPLPCCCHPAQCRNHWSLGWRRRERQLVRRIDSRDPKGKMWDVRGGVKTTSSDVFGCSSVFGSCMSVSVCLSDHLSICSAHHVPWVGHEEVLSHVRRQKIEENPPVVQLDFLHAVPLLFRLTAWHMENT